MVPNMHASLSIVRQLVWKWLEKYTSLPPRLLPCRGLMHTLNCAMQNWMVEFETTLARGGKTPLGCCTSGRHCFSNANPPKGGGIGVERRTPTSQLPDGA